MIRQLKDQKVKSKSLEKSSNSIKMLLDDSKL